jgi:flagellar hook protein FlgE
MSSAFSIALSSLQAESAAINTTGNNLANMNTDGFKGSAVDFKDLFSASMGNGASYDSGLGVTLPVNNQLFTQGAIQTSSAPLSAAIQGNGFFVVNSPSGQQLYTRDGNFVQNAAGELQTETGEAVQGWTAGANGISTTKTPGNIVLPADAVLPPVATQNFSINANLDSQATVAGTPNTFSAPMQVVDSLGNTHQLSINFTQSTIPATAPATGSVVVPGSWTYNVTIPNGDLSTGTAANATNPVALGNGTGTVSFSPTGALTMLNGLAATTSTPAIAITTPALADGAAAMTMNWTLLNVSGTAQLTDYSQASGLASSAQDGTTSSSVTSVGIQNGGQVVATYSNGQTKVEAQLAMAEIQNPTSLQNVGNNNLAAGANTAIPAVGMPQTGGRGQILGGAVESSNVDMATQFTNLIVYQSAYQASSRVISTEQTIDQDVLQLIH